MPSCTIVHSRIYLCASFVDAVFCGILLMVLSFSSACNSSLAHGTRELRRNISKSSAKMGHGPARVPLPTVLESG